MSKYCIWKIVHEIWLYFRIISFFHFSKCLLCNVLFNKFSHEYTEHLIKIIVGQLMQIKIWLFGFTVLKHRHFNRQDKNEKYLANWHLQLELYVKILYFDLCFYVFSSFYIKLWVFTWTFQCKDRIQYAEDISSNLQP